ncbi:hypothetical protein [Absidia glauca]|uniref:Nuclear pore protein n=1 Tax=Absidia glauca TaxID=4829 RepID=A0A168QEM5_ABSGL|nr:hypothetical protein [Absidia glauca]
MTPSERPRRKTYNKALENIHTYYKPKKRGGRSKKQAPEMKKVSPKKRPVGSARSSPRPPHVPFDDIVPGPSDYAIDVSADSPVPGPSNYATSVSNDPHVAGPSNYAISVSPNPPVAGPSNYATAVSTDPPVAGPSHYAIAVSTDPPVAGTSNDAISVSTNTIYYSCFSSPASSYVTARQSFGSASTSNEQDNVSIKQESIESEDDDYYGINSSRWDPSTYQPPPRNSDSRSPMAPTPPPPSLLINYAEAVVDLNLHRLQGQDCRIGAKFFTTMRNEYDANIHGSDFHQLCLAWNFIRYVAGENRSSLAPLNYRRLEARFVPSVAAPEHYHSDRAVRARKCLIERTKIWLEDMWWEDMKRVVLNADVVEPIMDGDLNWIYRYISITMMTSGLWVWNDDRLEIFSHIPIWAMVYYACRSGRTEAILHYMRTHTDWFDPNIIVCFEDYIDNRPFSEHNQSWIEREELACHDNRGDPFKWMFLQLISRKYTPIPGGSVIIKGSYDNLWTHLNMIRENPTFSRAPNYTLEDIQSAVRFYPIQDDNLLEVVHMNLMTFQFERAVHMLYENQDTRLHAVHLAITLMYYGLLRIPDTPTEHLRTYTVMDAPNGQATWDMKTMLDRYLQAPVNEGFPTTFQDMSPHYAIHYLALLTIYTSRNDYRNDDAISVSRSSVRLLASIENENEFFENLHDHTEEYSR